MEVHKMNKSFDKSLVLAALAAAAMLAACGKNEAPAAGSAADAVKQEQASQAPSVGEAAKQMGDAATNMGKAVGEAAKDAASEAVQAASQAAQDAKNAAQDAKEAAHDAMNEAKEMAHDAAQATGQAVQDAKNAASEGMDAAKQAADDAAQKAAEAAGAAKEAAQGALNAFCHTPRPSCRLLAHEGFSVSGPTVSRLACMEEGLSQAFFSSLIDSNISPPNGRETHFRRI